MKPAKLAQPGPHVLDGKDKKNDKSKLVSLLVFYIRLFRVQCQYVGAVKPKMSTNGQHFDFRVFGIPNLFLSYNKGTGIKLDYLQFQEEEKKSSAKAYSKHLLFSSASTLKFYVA